MAQRFTVPNVQLVNDDASSVAAGWKLNFYATGTSTRKDTFSDSALTTANANPVVADSAGRFGSIFLESGTYKVVLTDDADVVKWTADPVEGAVGTSGSVSSQTADFTVTSSDSTKTFAVDATSGAVTASLLAAATAGDGFENTFKKTDSSANAVTIDPNGSETIDDAASFVISGQYEAVTIRSDGTNWNIKSRQLPDISQALAEAGTSTLPKEWTALRVAQAIAALAKTSAFLRGHIAGLGLSNNATDASHDIDIAVGEATDAAVTTLMQLTSALTKQIDATWAAGTNAGGLSSSLTAPANSTWYHVHLIKVSGSVDVGFDTSITAANLVTDHSATAYRRIGSVLTDGSANIIAFIQSGDDFLWTTPVLDIDIATPSTTLHTPIALTIPPGVRSMVRANIFFGALGVYVSSVGQTDQAPATTATPLASVYDGANANGGYIEVLSDTAKAIQYRCLSNTNFRLATIGYRDSRGRFA